MKDQVGDVRIRRCDRHGFVTQKLEDVETREAGKKTGAMRLEWMDKGYFSHAKWACKMALKDLIDEGCNGGDTKELLASIRRLEARIPQIVEGIQVTR